MTQGTIKVIATPIGNLRDISLRAIDELKASDVILCEDTRVTGFLLKNFAISKPLLSYHQHSGTRKIRQIKELLSQGKKLALVTDAGTPGISDPGNLLIRQLTNIDERFTIIPIPGPSALIAALSISGFPTDKFLFMGFPPHKNKRQKFFKELTTSPNTVVFYESGHRIKKCLTELQKVIDPKRKIVVCRELTKMFETIYRGTIDEIIDQAKEVRGEFVVVINAP